MRQWICLWDWRYEASAHSGSRHVITTEAKYMRMELSDLLASAKSLVEGARTARRVLGGAHPETAAFEKSLQNVRAALRAREESVRLRDELAAAQDKAAAARAASHAINAELEALRLENARARAALRARETPPPLSSPSESA